MLFSRGAVLGSVAIAAGAVAGGCSDRSEPRAPAEPVPAPRDAGSDGVTIIGGFDPASGMHLDDEGGRIDPARLPRQKPRPGKPIDIMLKSSPPGALAAVDGVQVGMTPTHWSGEDGREHEFTFVLRGHAVARYRFVPVTSGTVHARLEPITEDVSDGGLGPMISPTFAPDAPVGAPPTVLNPADAGPRTTPAVPADAGAPSVPPVQNDALPMPPEEPRPGVGPRP